ncbi:hypothetical protein [uncultured Flavobacterium sp.]|uniref:hypothetical protein n=1 Tax=uncultured Flavobacterium sp. TaxID=165435 RepID=UPI0027E04BF2|nr:hypothetical protein [uncultured Flavobacterium sp.]
MSKEICEELKSLTKLEFEKIINHLPSDPIVRFILFTESLRVLDLNSILFRNSTDVSRVPSNDILKMGWNLLASILFEGHFSSGFPIMKSTEETFAVARGVLHHCGCITMVNRTVDMIYSGVLTVEKENNKYVFKKTENANSQFLDDLEISQFQNLENELKNNIGGYYNDWNVVEKNNLEKAFNSYGNFVSSITADFSSLFSDNIEELLNNQVYPWDSGHGVMTGYGSTPEIDMHFLGKAFSLIHEWREIAGLHPKTKIGNITGADVTSAVLYMTSFHLKHISCCLLASKKHSEISLEQSLTIWGPLDAVIDDIVEFSGMEKAIVAEAFESITLKPNDVNLLRTHTSRFMPLLIDIGNGIVLRPISSIERNPFLTINQILEYRNPNFRNDLSYHREEWLRNNLYAIFSGSRYSTIPGNITLKSGNIVETDIDAAILDITTGDLALFQIKWQDFFFNDAQKLRSRASNLTKSLDDWTQKVDSWIGLNGRTKLLQTLRLPDDKSTGNIYLFAISKNAARMQGYGYTVKSENLAISNWHQFMRTRHEVGPSKKVFKDLFDILKSEENKTVETAPLHAEFILSDKIFEYKDLWSTHGS